MADPNAKVGRELRDAWALRRRIVIELIGSRPGPVIAQAPQWWELGPGHTLGSEVWAHLLTANVVDARDPARPQFEPRTRALRLGAAPAGPDTPGDVVAPNAGSLWCDGGPLDSFTSEQLHGAGLVCAPNLAVGRLAPLRPAEPSAELAPDQLKAVAGLGGPACIVAPAGSGKTRVLTERARHLIRDLGVAPAAVCLVAFNVRARAEMQQRTADLTGLQVRTLNSLGLAICNGTGPFARPAGMGRVEVIDEPAARDVLAPLIPRRQRRAMTDPLAPWLEALGASRLGLRNPAEVERDYAPDVTGFTDVAPAYVAELANRGVVDFDHQIIRAVQILLSDHAARAAARRACGVLLVDEFQDLTPAHLLLVRLLAGPRAEVFGVGDDDQTIYGYTGANPEWLINYQRYFPCADERKLLVNYRCPPEVVTAATNLLSHNRHRVPKKITSSREDQPTPESNPARTWAGGESGDGSDAVISVLHKGAAELVKHVGALLAGGVDTSDVAVLTRVNSTLLAPQIALASAGIACMRPVGPWFLERTGVAAALAWLRLAVAPSRALPAAALATAARRPPRGISPRVVEWVAEQRSISRLRALAGRLTDERSSRRVHELADDIEHIRDVAASGAGTRRLLEAVRDMGLGASIDERLDGSRRSVDRSAHGDDLRALLSVAAFHDSPASFQGWLESQLTRNHDTANDTPAGDPVSAATQGWGEGVRLATVHRTKGMQWPHVVVFEAAEGLMPHRLASDLEEERRVFHVAITRCSESLLILTGGAESPYIAEMQNPAPPDPPDPPHSPAPQPTPPGQGPRPLGGAAPETNTPPEPAGEGSPRFGQRLAPPGAVPKPGQPQRAAPAPPEPLSGPQEVLRGRLREWRLQRSQTDGVPAYVVLHDKVMTEIARRAPTNKAELAAIKGIGPAKIENYGDDILRIVNEDGDDDGGS